ncbi:nuclease-related domain-containing protein [Bacillus sp. FJAT-22090]|uniref:nuclease-related domain-containing protein n=1 Tax=Bacillus sp. FJAT-22090 TaxID=1581038 RepID=UPI0016424D57|nr:nuclease-related domain-containing protein [Bacillus sp. FJAT-22090]
MIIIEIFRPEPTSLYALTQLKHRIPSDQGIYPQILENIENLKAGYYGECRADRFIEEVQFPKEVVIIPDLHTKLHPKKVMQIDTLIITTSYILVLEIKNITGTIRFIPNNPSHLVRTKDDKVTSFKCPLVQLARNTDGINNILNNLNLNIPVYEALIFASQNLIVENAPPQRNIFFVQQLPLFLQKLNKLPPKIKTNQFHLLTKTFTNLNKNFIERPLCSRFAIDPEMLKKGILCIYCGNNLSRVTERKWICASCKQIDKQPIQNNIQNLFILINQNITMKDCLHYLQPPSREVIKYYIKRMKLPKTGNHRTTIYTKQLT